ncbi:2-keto-4-pentenoate hydratase [Jatrophihabitans endophyticus]|uniref:2-keto-4-pentenoate hydratase n=1 Tax=Jatrophihabitans endophyticus TaxID=1206085 RepID=UPI0026F0FBD1|nr:fumarylacetoacetate hydrolase family protein [Jatrophihabitans endophyticus]
MAADLDAEVDLAYDVQQAIVAARVAAGARVVGRKIGLTNPKVRAQLGVDRPDFGVLLDDMQATQDEPIDAGRLLAPRIEAEIAFVLGADLDRPDVSTADVRDATAYVRTAFEIVDSRIAGWDITISDTIADNGSSAMFVLGDAEVPLDGLDLAAASMTMTRHGEVVSEGLGSDCLGDPVAAVAWLAENARRYGQPLRAGEIVLSGALGPVVPVVAGDAFTARIEGLGDVRASFAGTS